jgi:RNA polymerase sigma-70 factor (ECF subfamily)
MYAKNEYQGSAFRGTEPLDDLLSRLRPRFRQVLARFRIPAQDAEDILQEALVAAVHKWEEIQDPEAWLMVTLRNRCLIYWRRRRDSVFSNVDQTLLELLVKPQEPPQEKAELHWDLETLLTEVPERCRQLLRLRYGLGLSSAEAAARMGLRADSARKATQRCLAALTRQLLSLGPVE